MIKYLRIFAVISYVLIMLAGWMSALPLIFWLLFTMFDFGNIDQLFSICAVIGIILNFTKLKNSISISLLAFVLMLSPLASRMVQVPISVFNYWGFKIPLLIFFVSYILSLLLLIKNKVISDENVV